MTGQVWEYKAVVKLVEKTIEYRKIVMAIKKPIEFTVERTCLAEHNEKLGLLIFFLSRSSGITNVALSCHSYLYKGFHRLQYYIL